VHQQRFVAEMAPLGYLMRQSEPFRRLQACSVSSQQAVSIARKGSQQIEGATFGQLQGSKSQKTTKSPISRCF
jgi:hypothetical protein